MRKKIGTLVFVMLFLLCGSLHAAENSKEVTVTGTLVRVFAIGGETTGWGIELDSPLQVEGETLNKIEIDLCGKKINLFPFVGDKVEVTGTLVKRKGIERGPYWVIEVGSFSR